MRRIINRFVSRMARIRQYLDCAVNGSGEESTSRNPKTDHTSFMSCQCLYTSHVLNVPHLSAEGGQEVRWRYQQLVNQTHPNGLVVGGTEELGLSRSFKNSEVINGPPVSIQSAQWFPGVNIPNLYGGHRLSSSQNTWSLTTRQLQLTPIQCSYVPHTRYLLVSAIEYTLPPIHWTSRMHSKFSKVQI